MLTTKFGRKISNVIVNTIFGIDGNMSWLLKLKPNMQELIEVVKETGTIKFGKSFTFLDKKGNVRHWNPLTWFKYVKAVGESSMINAYGLTNKGLYVEGKRIAEASNEKFIPNFAPDFSRPKELILLECREVINFMRSILGNKFDTLIFNGSCPNTGEEVGDNVEKITYVCGELCKEYPWLELIVKISYMHPYEMSEELERVGIRIIESINTIPHKLLFPDKKSPIKKGGGYSGEVISPYSFKYNYGLRKRVNLKLIMAGGVTTCNEVRSFMDIGADAVAACTVFRRNPKEGMRILEKYNGGE